ncbi:MULTISPECIES: phosphatase PAP2 family protein [Natrialbaceae]|uniref:phosphatase PAP2 family protein n=1 Tax=Natrialbaceae TaxID=1644061 RepID=UPI00207C5F17|nr:phosphatase PAP2 family protein [Natronococcus sp. CG52]
MRLEAESETIRESVPAEYADLAVLVTELGGTTVLMFLLAILFWLSSRRRSALVIAYALVGFSLLLATKAALGMPRPPEEVFLKPLSTDEYGFPSGHAFAAVVVYGGLLSAYDRVRDYRALVAVGTLIVLISLSRVVLGVHYLGDVIVGVGLGIVFLAGMDPVTRGEPRRAFAVAVVLSVPAAFVVGPSADALLGLGGSIGGFLASARVDDLPPVRSRAEGAVLVLAGSGFIAVVLAIESVVVTTEALAAPRYALLLAGTLLVPAVVGRFEFGGRDTDAF